MRAIIVAVDYDDLLAVTLAYNRHHFNSVLVVTNLASTATKWIAESNDAEVYQTDSFYTSGAPFCKYKALEEGLEYMGREGWICQMDADILWPRQLPNFAYRPGYLYTPLCRIMADLKQPIPTGREETWTQYPLRRNQAEWAGYTQIYHASDRHLGRPPWHETDWIHAGGGDSMFQRKWPRQFKIRPPWEALHLGAHGTNWCGRATTYLDGTNPKQRLARLRRLRELMKVRRRNRNFNHERLGSEEP